MTDSILTGGLLNGGTPRTSLCDLPPEMLCIIFSHSNLVSLVHLSATCHRLRHQVHEIFTSRIEDQGNKYPEVKQSLDRLRWKRNHDSWNCKCFQMMAGPSFTWAELEEEKSFSLVCYPNLSRTSTTAGGKTFVATPSTEGLNILEVAYAEMAPGGGAGHSVQTLSTFNDDVNGVYLDVDGVYLASYHNVLAVVNNRFLLDFGASVCIFNASTLAKVCEMSLGDDEDAVMVWDVALTRDTMLVHLQCFNDIGEVETKIQIWKINTEDPQEPGIALHHTMTHHNAPLSQDIVTSGYQSFCINDRFTVIHDEVVKVFGRNGETPLVCQVEIENKTVKAMAMQGGQGDHLALALIGVNADRVPELTVKVYSVTLGNLVVQKEIGTFLRKRSAPFFMNWFGDHLMVCSQQANSVYFFSWQPGLPSFLIPPCTVPVVRRSARGNRGGEPMWEASCLHIDFQGITTAVSKTQVFYGFKKSFFKTWKSAS